MSKRDLPRFHLHTSLPTRQPRGHKLVIRLARGSKASSLAETEHLNAKVVRDRRSNPAYKRRQGVFLRWSLLWLMIVSVVGSMVIGGTLLLTKLPPPANCQRISPLSPDSERLYCAQLAAQSGEFEQLLEAIAIVQYWSPNHSLYPQAQQLLREWSQMVLQFARETLNQGNYTDALKMAMQIPVSSPLYPEAQVQIATWKQERIQAQAIVSQVQDALKVQNWQQAAKLISQLSRLNDQYWSVSRYDTLTQQLAAEKQAWTQLQEARDLAKSNQLPKIEQAIALAAKVDPNSYIKAQAQSDLSNWSRTLLQIAATRFQNQEYQGVIEVAQGIPINTSLYQEAQDWLRLGQAGKLVQQNTILAFIDALTAVRQLDDKSPVQTSAAAQAIQWEAQLQDRLQLRLAKITASFEQRPLLQMAIEQAALITPDRPQRIEAQTHIAQWRKQIQHIDDRNTLRTAQQLATGGTIDQLNAAVTQARKIEPGQPLRPEAQSAIAQWNRQIETLEDQPILDLARAFAQRRDLIAAISTANQIRPGRMLYAEAQSAIAQWVAQIQTAQDRPILEAAAALAAQGRFDAAIATAAQIPPERALYQQAQAAIALWKSQQNGG
ncbi:MAG: hypothetical protein RIB93_25390 [Coleofasciculus sp. D1-CHI-01]|uniref:hypothetical protein n=1 Tax=Coleofasciculus sp. D1-CHI-01 TaxID=3068482 RepID=UPI0032F29F8D